MFDGIIEHLNIQTNQNGKLKDATFVAKDLLDIKGMVTGGGNPDWKKTHLPASKNCFAVQSLLNDGARLVGKSLTDELAFSLDGLNVHYQTPHNPNFPGCITGGSSSGSASAVANGACDFSLGTDTAGSIRVPAAYCGIYGMRPTHNRISLEGAIPLGPTFDTIGFMSKSIDLMNQVGSVLLCESILSPQIEQISLLEDSFSNLNQALHNTFTRKWEAILELCKQFNLIASKTENFNKEISNFDSFGELFNIARGFEAWTAHGKWFKQTNPQMNEAIKQRFFSCQKVSETDYKQALSERTKSIKEVNQKLRATFLFLPTVSSTPLDLNASEDELMQNRKANIALNSLASFCGLPQISIPYNFEDKKLAFSIVGAQGTDMKLLALAKFLTQAGILD